MNTVLFLVALRTQTVLILGRCVMTLSQVNVSVFHAQLRLLVMTVKQKYV